MATLNQVRIQWTGVGGMPGVTTFYSDASSAPPLAAYKTFFGSVAAIMPTALKISYPTSGLKIDSASGQAIGSWTAASQADTVGGDAGVYASPVGAVINWLTGVYVNGRQLRGKTFLVPICGGRFDTDGTLSPTTRTTLINAAAALLAAGAGPTVWSKASGQVAISNSAAIPDKAAVLRSRRD